MEKIPQDVAKALRSNTKAQEEWNNLTPIGRRDFLGWIESAKKEETRKRRIARINDMLVSGKRRPCCYAIVPMNVHKALASVPKAKAMWATLTPDERRDFVAWIGAVSDVEKRQQRIEKVCVLLSKGKRRP